MSTAAYTTTDPAEAKKLTNINFATVDGQMFYESRGRSRRQHKFGGVWFPCKQVFANTKFAGDHFVDKCSGEHKEILDAIIKQGVFHFSHNIEVARDFLSHFDTVENMRRSLALGDWKKCKLDTASPRQTDAECSAEFQMFIDALIVAIKS